ncbi:hypothetical protein [Paenibacillus sp. NPDC058174]|uniref:hypothetical protein n=1 Tax=Paenibacillus sp. NPDC058174 TaxID=3346366 RepID=UPI0036D97BF3
MGVYTIVRMAHEYSVLNLFAIINHNDSYINSIWAGEFKMSENKLWLVVQYPLKSAKGSQRDQWLKDKVMEYLELSLADADLGCVDGFDMGVCISDPKKYALNIFCVVSEEERSIALVKRVLRESRLDYTRIKIATMPYGEEGTYTLKYAHKKGVADFTL